MASAAGYDVVEFKKYLAFWTIHKKLRQERSLGVIKEITLSFGEFLQALGSYSGSDWTIVQKGTLDMSSVTDQQQIYMLLALFRTLDVGDDGKLSVTDLDASLRPSMAASRTKEGRVARSRSSARELKVSDIQFVANSWVGQP